MSFGEAPLRAIAASSRAAKLSLATTIAVALKVGCMYCAASLGRTNAAKAFDQLVAAIEVDLGGRDQLSTIERALIEAFAGACVTLHHLNTKLALGESIDPSQHAQAVSAMVRVATRLGLARRAKDIGPGLGDLLREDLRQQREAGARVEQ
jgi:hypothetical protein